MDEVQMGNEGFFGGFLDGMPLFFVIFFLVIIGIILFTIIASIVQWNKNNHSPIENVIVKVVSKRTRVSGGSGEHSASTYYYITFEKENLERTELAVMGRDYGMIAEGDKGMLTYQGTRFKEFNRIV
jgi:hypothetical protein